MEEACIFAGVKIAVNTRFLLPHRLEGIGWFTYEVFKRLVQRHPEHEFYFYFDRSFPERFVFGDNVKPHRLPPPARHPILWRIWFNISVFIRLKIDKPDVFVSPDGFVSLPYNGRQLSVIHDINFEHHPEYLPTAARRFHLKYFRIFARKATRIATVSQYSADDIASTYGISADKIDLVYNGIGDFFRELSAEEQIAVREKLLGGKRYFIFVGALNPRKNLEGMLRAFDRYREAGGDKEFVVVGTKMFWTESIEQTYAQMRHKDHVHFIGRLEREGLNRVLAAAHALLFVSHFEGFGIPMIEAFQCGTPVIASDRTSIPEVAGDAALLCAPTDEAGIVEAMQRLDDGELRRNLIAKGKLRAKEFSWDRSADMMWASILKTMGDGA